MWLSNLLKNNSKQKVFRIFASLGPVSFCGFTLIETIVVILIFSLMMGAIAGFVFTGYRVHNYAFQQAIAIDEARRGIETMVKEIREAKIGEDGSYLLEKADDFELIFYSNIDQDPATERIRYFIKPAGGVSQTLTKDCVSYARGGTCSVSFTNFLTETLETATVRVRVEGDLDHPSETVDIYGDGQYLGRLCTQSKCSQCLGNWQDLTSFDVSLPAKDNQIVFTADASSNVNPICQWQQPNHSLKVRFEFSWTETPSPQATALFQKGVTKPSGWPPNYKTEDEKIYIISKHIQNEARAKPIFTYYDAEQNLLAFPERLEKTTFIKISLIINVDPYREPDDFELNSALCLRNLNQ